ncbi:MAG: L-threonylcarbamoyladenylate synthase [Candidatus Aminicenantales bacterium]
MRTKNTSCIQINPDRIQPVQIKRIAAVLRKGGVIAYPTDTFYGLGVDCFSQEAVQKIFRLKRRDYSKPLLVMVSGLRMVEGIVVSPPDVFWRLSRKFWPGPLTFVLKAKPLFPQGILSADQSIAVRLPNPVWLRELVGRVGSPVTATSANISGEKEISSSGKVFEIFSGKVDLIVDGGETPGGLPSTIVDMTSRSPRILREGAIPAAEINKYLKA